MKKFLLIFALALVALSASANYDATYWFNVNVDIKATGAGKVYGSLTADTTARQEQTTHINYHTLVGINDENYSNLSFYVFLYTEAEAGWHLKGFLLNGSEDCKSGTDKWLGDWVSVPFSESNKCGPDSLTDEQCRAQHPDSINTRTDAVITAVFEQDVPTAVTDVKATEVKSVKYVDLQGKESAKPFEGVNIVVETLADGTRRARKQKF